MISRKKTVSQTSFLTLAQPKTFAGDLLERTPCSEQTQTQQSAEPKDVGNPPALWLVTHPREITQKARESGKNRDAQWNTVYKQKNTATLNAQQLKIDKEMTVHPLNEMNGR